MNPIKKFFVRWSDNSGNTGQTMPDTDYEAMTKWSRATNKSQPDTRHWVEEWQQGQVKNEPSPSR